MYKNTNRDRYYEWNERKGTQESKTERKRNKKWTKYEWMNGWMDEQANEPTSERMIIKQAAI